MSIGDHQHARLLYDHLRRNGGVRAAPGYRKIGAGAYRTAYLKRDTEVVYKVGNNEANLTEATESRRLLRKSQRKLGFVVKVPVARTYRMDDENRVVAMEFAKNAKRTHCMRSYIWDQDYPCTCKANVCFATIHEQIQDWSGYMDVHYDNVLIDPSGVFWMVDLGHSDEY